MALKARRVTYTSTAPQRMPFYHASMFKDTAQYLHAPEIRIQAANVDVQPVVRMLRQAPLFVRHAQNKINAAVNLVLFKQKTKQVISHTHSTKTQR